VLGVALLQVVPPDVGMGFSDVLSVLADEWCGSPSGFSSTGATFTSTFLT
jgi:hypothetical protein